MNIYDYHWFCYLSGLICIPRITFVIFVALHCNNVVPFSLMAIGLLFAIMGDIIK